MEADLQTLLPAATDFSFSLITNVLAVPVLAGLAGTLRYVKFARLRRAFGAQVRGADDVSIILPLWRLLERNRNVPRFEKEDGRGRTRQLFGPDRTFAEDDSTSAFHVAQIFGSFFPQPIAMRPDDERDPGKDAVNIYIGSHLANRMAAHLLAMHERAGVELPLSFADIDECAENGAAMTVRNAATGEEYSFDGVDDYAFVMRFPKQDEDEGFDFICAGIDAAGTLAAGIFLRRRWRRFARFRGPVAVVLKLTRDRPDQARPIAWVHRKGERWVSTPAKARK